MIRRLLVVFPLLLSATLSFAQENRTYDGIGNNEANREWGSKETVLLRSATVNYEDDIQSIRTDGLPLAREISNKLFSQSESVPSVKNLSDFVWVFGQFIANDISLVESDPSQSQLLEIPQDDASFTTDAKLSVERSAFVDGTGVNGIPRAYANQVSSFIDGSMIYGSDEERANWLRSFEGGELKVSKAHKPSGDLLPWNTLNKEYGGLPDNLAPSMNTNGRITKYFVCGDVRANENPLLLSMHTLFVREHNRLCKDIVAANPNWSDEQIYQRARKMIGAYLQSITYNEWLPTVGVDFPAYFKYQQDIEPGVLNSFSSAAFQINETMSDGDIELMQDDGTLLDKITISGSLYAPQLILGAQGIDVFFKGMGTKVAEEMDCKMVDGLRNMFSDQDQKVQDMAAFRVFRGRDRGLSDYNTMRQDFGLAPLSAFSHITESSDDIEILQDLYNGDINKIDAWVGMLSEKHLSDDAIFGELVMTIVKEQFRILRDADRFYFENDPAFTPSQIEDIRNTSMHDIVMRNTNISVMQDNVFSAMPHSEIPVLDIDETNLNALFYPNPVDDVASLRVYSEKNQTLDYSLINLNGQVLWSKKHDLIEGGDNLIKVYFDQNIPTGMYQLLLTTESDFNIIKLMK